MLFRAIPYWLFAVAIIVTSLLSPSPAAACSCAPAPDPVTALGQSAAVFSGKVLRVEEPVRMPFSSTPARIGFDVTFEVQTVWKGALQSQVLVVTSGLGGGCGIPFQPGDEYLVYASYWEHSDLETNICTRTTLLADATEDLQALGTGSAPLPPPPSSASDWTLPAFAGAVAVVFCVIALFLFYRQKSKRRR